MKEFKYSIVDKTELANFIRNIKSVFNRELSSMIFYINVDNSISVLKEVNIYLTQIKSRNTSINNLITPLENRIKLYVNFQKKVFSLSKKQLEDIKNIILTTPDKYKAERKIKAVAPILFSDITKDEFFCVFEKFYNAIENIKEKDYIFIENEKENSR